MRRLTSPILMYWYFLYISVFFVDTASSTTVAGASIAGGLFHTCVILWDLSLRCFGGGSSEEVLALVAAGETDYGNFGQLGTGNNETLGDEGGEMGDNLPTVDLGNNTVQMVAAGQSHTCVLLGTADVACWGYNLYGQLGVGDIVDRGLSPSDMGEGLALVDLGTGRTATYITCGQYHTCAVLDNGSVKCWGRNKYGMLGLGDTLSRGDEADEMGDNLPAVDLGTGQTAVAVEGGQYHTCALLASAAVKCWGGKNETGLNYGQLGQGDTNDIGQFPGQMGDNLPEVDLGTDRTAVALAVGFFHTCVILDNTDMHCFGRNFDGQLGLGDTEDRGDEEGEMGDNMVAVDLGVGRYAIAMSLGRWHTCVLMDNTDIKCFGVSTTDDLGAGQLGLEDEENRGISLATTGDGLETVYLGIGRTNSFLFTAYDHNCVLFADYDVKCWGLNKSGQLGIGSTEDRGAAPGSMGDELPEIQVGLKVASPPEYSTLTSDAVGEEEAGESGLGLEMTITASLLGAAGGFCILGAMCLFCRRRLEAKGKSNTTAAGVDAFAIQGAGDDSGVREVETASGITWVDNVVPRERDPAPVYTMRKGPEQIGPLHSQSRASVASSRFSVFSGREAGMAAAGTAGIAIAGGLSAGWNVMGVVAENLPWIGVAYHMLNEIADIVDTRNAMQGNMEKIRSWAISLQEVLLTMGKQMRTTPAINARALENMSKEVITNLRTLVTEVAAYDAKGALAQYTSSRSCQKAIDAADTALRGALVKLSVGQGAELIAMVGRLQSAGLVMDEKLDIIIEHLRKQDEKAERLELRLAEYSESMAEVLGQFANENERGRHPSGGKTVAELGREKLDRLQISQDEVSYPSNVPFASGMYSEVYQVVHEGVIKAAKKTNLTRLGVGGQNDVNRVFKRFVKELYIMSQMHSDRVVSVYGAIASPTELTLVMEFVERGSLRAILDDETQRKTLTPARQLSLIADTAAGMAYLYKNGVAHRDLKSANCLVTHDWRVKITDFGLSETTDAISTGTESNVFGGFRGGTMVYMAPELMLESAHKEVPAELSDMFSFGVVVWDVVCGAGETPWAGTRMSDLPLMLKRGKRLSIPADCGRFYRKLMLNCWREDPYRRPKFDLVQAALVEEREGLFAATRVQPRQLEAPLKRATIDGSGAPTRLDLSAHRETRRNRASDQMENLILRATETMAATTRAQVFEMRASVGRSSSFVASPRRERQCERTQSDDSVFRISKVHSPGFKRGLGHAHASSSGADSWMSSGRGGNEGQPPDVDARDSRLSASGGGPAASASTARETSEAKDSSSRVREPSNRPAEEARAVAPGPAVRPRERRTAEGRRGEGAAAGLARPSNRNNNNREVQVVHGFRLTSSAEGRGES